MSHRRKHLYSVVALTFLALASVSGCSRSLSLDEEIRASNSTAQWLVERHGAVRNRHVLRYLTGVQRRLASGVEGLRRHRDLSYFIQDNAAWQIILLDSPQPNAFSAGSGIIVLTRGFVAACSAEAELAAVVAHEMAHQLLGHTREALHAAAEQERGPVYTFSLSQELDADALSLEILRLARYDIRYATAPLRLASGASDRVVSSEAGGWLTARAASLERGIDNAGSFLPATANTREFLKAREQLR